MATKTMKQDTCTVTNRSGGEVVYLIPALEIRRDLGVGQTIKVPKKEIEALAYEPGGLNLIRDYLYVQDKELLDDLSVETEIEYSYDATDVAKIIQTGSVDEFKDMIDFAPEGVINMVKDLAIQLPMTDLNKIAYLKEKTGFDVQAALIKDTSIVEDDSKDTKPKRRASAGNKAARRVPTEE